MAVKLGGQMFGSLGAPEIILILIALFILALPILTIIDIVRSKFESNIQMIWVIIVLFLPFIGPILYFIIGTRQKIKS